MKGPSFRRRVEIPRALLLAAAAVCLRLPARASDEPPADRARPAPPAAAKPAAATARPDAAPSPNAPQTPTDPASAEIARAIREAKKELDALKAEAAQAERELGSRVAAESQDLLSVSEERRRLDERLEALTAESRGLDGKLAELAEAQSRAAETLKAVTVEVESQAAAFQGRFAGSLSALEDARLLDAAAECLKPARPVRERLGGLLDGYEKVLLHAQTAAAFPMPLRLGGGDKAEKLSLLRLGLLCGYYARPIRKDGGFMVSEIESRTGLRTEATGLEQGQKAMIAALVQNPDRGGPVPIDVTGGAALAALKAKAPPREWLEMAGVFRWPLLAIAALALIVIIERTVLLAGRSLGLGKGIRRVLALVKSGRIEAAETAAARMRGPEGKLLREALSNRDHQPEVLECAVRTALLESSPLFHAHLSFLTLCGAVAPLIGVLGTVAGLFGVFRMASILGGGDPRAVTGGLAESLAALELGLAIAIPCLIARGLLAALAEWGMGKLEAGAFAAVIALRKEGRRPVGVEEPVS